MTCLAIGMGFIDLLKGVLTVNEGPYFPFLDQKAK
jgi:hypothetical protein